MRRAARVWRRRRNSRRLGLDSCRRLGARCRMLARRPRRRRCSGTALHRRCGHAIQCRACRSASSAGRIFGCMSLKSYLVLLTLHSLHLVRSRARKVYHEAARLAHSVVIRARGLLSTAKAAKHGSRATESDISFKHRCVSIIAFDIDAFVAWIRRKRAAAWRWQLASCAPERHFLHLTLHRLHLVRSRTREVHHAAAGVAHSVVLRARSLFSSAKAATKSSSVASPHRYNKQFVVSYSKRNDALERRLRSRARQSKAFQRVGNEPQQKRVERTLSPSLPCDAPVEACSPDIACGVEQPLAQRECERVAPKSAAQEDTP